MKMLQQCYVGKVSAPQPLGKPLTRKNLVPRPVVESEPPLFPLSPPNSAAMVQP